MIQMQCKAMYFLTKIHWIYRFSNWNISFTRSNISVLSVVWSAIQTCVVNCEQMKSVQQKETFMKNNNCSWSVTSIPLFSISKFDFGQYDFTSKVRDHSNCFLWCKCSWCIHRCMWKRHRFHVPFGQKMHWLVVEVWQKVWLWR